MQNKHWTGISRNAYRRVMPVNRVPVRNFVDGLFVDGPSSFDKVSPVDGVVVADVHLADSVLVDRAVQAAHHAAAIVNHMRRIEQARAQHRHDRHRDQQRHCQRERHDRGEDARFQARRTSPRIRA